MSDKTISVCGLCGEPMPEHEQMFKFHGYSGPCPKPPLPAPAAKPEPRMSISDLAIARDERVAELTEALGKALDIIVWMSGSPSFGPEGEAHTGWLANGPALESLFKIQNPAS